MAKSFYWSDDKLGTLIDMYQERIYLYITKHKNYFNRDIRNDDTFLPLYKNIE